MQNASAISRTDLHPGGVARVEVLSLIPRHCTEVHMVKYLFKVVNMSSVPLVLEEVN